MGEPGEEARMGDPGENGWRFSTGLYGAGLFTVLRCYCYEVVVSVTAAVYISWWVRGRLLWRWHGEPTCKVRVDQCAVGCGPAVGDGLDVDGEVLALVGVNAQLAQHLLHVRARVRSAVEDAATAAAMAAAAAAAAFACACACSGTAAAATNFSRATWRWWPRCLLLRLVGLNQRSLLGARGGLHWRVPQGARFLEHQADVVDDGGAVLQWRQVSARAARVGCRRGLIAETTIHQVESLQMRLHLSICVPKDLGDAWRRRTHVLVKPSYSKLRGRPQGDVDPKGDDWRRCGR